MALFLAFLIGFTSGNLFAHVPGTTIVLPADGSTGGIGGGG
jgi:hypothetical protein